MRAKKNRICKICGVNINNRKNNAQYCKECSLERAKESGRKANKTFRTNNRDKLQAQMKRYRTRKKLKEVSLIVDENRTKKDIFDTLEYKGFKKYLKKVGRGPDD